MTAENFVSLSFEVYGIAMLILIGIGGIASLKDNDKWGMISVSAMVAISLIFMILMAYFHIVPTGKSYNNLCEPSNQEMGYCK